MNRTTLDYIGDQIGGSCPRRARGHTGAASRADDRQAILYAFCEAKAPEHVLVAGELDDCILGNSLYFLGLPRPGISALLLPSAFSAVRCTAFGTFVMISRINPSMVGSRLVVPSSSLNAH
jgi:hypothetical protein